MNLLNAIFCVWVSYVAFAFMAHRHPPKLFKDMLMQGGLAVVFAFGIGAAILAYRTGGQPPWWTVTFRGGLALVATMLYDMQFGVKRHWLMLLRWTRGWGD